METSRSRCSPQAAAKLAETRISWSSERLIAFRLISTGRGFERILSVEVRDASAHRKEA
jgi:hypothetical protein